MSSPRDWLRGSGARITLAFTAVMVGLLLIVNVVVSERGNQLFRASFPPSGNTSTDVRYHSEQQAVSNSPQKDATASLPDRFYEELLWVTLFGVIAAVVLGLTLGYVFITKPLRHLQRAIERLKEQNFHSHMPATGLPEYDRVLQDFNELAKELGRAEELRKDLISDTSHELKTPIQSLMLQIEGMRDGLIAKDDAQFEQLIHQVNKLDGLIEQLQEYARLRSQLIKVRPKTHKLLPIVQEAARGLSDELLAANVRMVYAIDPRYTVRADHVLLERIFTNLLRNTILHGNADLITISADEIEIVVADNGRGVASVDHLFERFYRAKPNNAPGLGLGLSIVRDIAEAHGWKVHAVSSSGKGLAVHIITSTSNSL